MADFTPYGQPPPERPEAVRKQQIANIPDPVLREKLQDIAKERDAAIKTFREESDKTRGSRIDTKRDQRVDKAYANAPDAPTEYQGKGGYQRATQDAKASDVSNTLKNEQAIAHSFNKQIDPHLDEHFGQYDRKSNYEQFQKLNRETLPAKESEAPAKKDPPAQAARSNDAVKRDTLTFKTSEPQREAPAKPAPDAKEKDFSATKRETLTFKPPDRDRDR